MPRASRGHLPYGTGTTPPVGSGGGTRFVAAVGVSASPFASRGGGRVPASGCGGKAGVGSGGRILAAGPTGSGQAVCGPPHGGHSNFFGHSSSHSDRPGTNIRSPALIW